MKYNVTMEILCCILIICSITGLTKGQLTTKPTDRQKLCDSDDISQCYESSSNQICSGRGDCVCGLCQCSSRRGDLPLKYTGKWCQCDDSTCPAFNGALCGGSDHGVCDCGFCKCYNNYTGRNCGCSTKSDMCEADDGSICGGHGRCRCNKCKCDFGFAGKTCTECKNCNMCEATKRCVECVLYKSQCSPRCNKMNIHVVEDVQRNVSSNDGDKGQYCKYEGITFTIIKQSRNGIQIAASRTLSGDKLSASQNQDAPDNSGSQKSYELWISLVLATVLLLL